MKKLSFLFLFLCVSFSFLNAQEVESPVVGKLILVPAGTIRINKKTTNTITNDFYIAACEVTREAFLGIMGYDAAHLYNSREMTNPANSLNWLEAVMFCNRLSVQEGLEPVYYLVVDGEQNYDPSQWGVMKFESKSLRYNKAWKGIGWNVSANGYRLPTETEWILAAVGTDAQEDTTKIQFSGVRKGDKLEDFAWYSWNSNNVFHPVGLKKPNGLGIYDMTGNASEWCYDWYSVKTPAGELTDYCGPETGEWKVYKGGNAFYKNGSALMLKYRAQGSAFTQVIGNPGFRVARNCPGTVIAE